MRNTSVHAINIEFCALFATEMKGFYLLSLLLTADEAKAEKCFVSSLEGCIEGNSVFKEWAHSWAKRVTPETSSLLLLTFAAASEARSRRIVQWYEYLHYAISSGLYLCCRFLNVIRIGNARISWAARSAKSVKGGQRRSGKSGITTLLALRV